MTQTDHKNKNKSFYTRLRCWTVATCITLAAMAVLFLILSRIFPFPRERLLESQADASALILDRNGKILTWRVDPHQNWRLPIPLNRVSPWILKATVAAEDKRFRSHPGVDPVALARAAGQNLFYRKRISGASTLTMQTVRLLWPRPRTWWAKTVEAFRAVQLEHLAAKDRILELYLNLAPYGGNVVGIEAAAHRYFDKSAADLTVGEAALLAGLPQNPTRFNPEKNLDRALDRRNYVLTQMQQLNLISEADLKSALREPIKLYRTPNSDIPGVTDYLLTLNRGQGGILRTTLDPNIQSAVTGTLDRRARDLIRMGIDGAAVVIDVPSASLAAMVGTLNPLDRRTGRINAAVAKRQPGSLLKPFIYADAFDLGLLTPDSVVYDTPGTWGDYRPRNMDREFLGPIPASRALTLSRNLPAVRLLDQIGTKRLARDIKLLGLNIPAAEERCGLSLALGTAETSLLDLANAYAALARLGTFQPLQIFSNDIPTAGTRIYSPGSAYLVLRALGAAGPDEPAKLIWKTGTSWHYRDAWAIALTPRHVVAVWCGKLCGQGHHALVGLHTAQPLALEIARLISNNTIASWPAPPAVRTRTVCALSGQPPTAACPKTLTAEFLPGTTLDLPCPLHQFQGSGRDQHVTIAWPKPVAAFLTESPKIASTSLTIHSPADNAEYIQTSPADHLPFTIDAGKNNEGRKIIFWFLNNELAATTPATAPYPWPMTPGRHHLIAADNQGHATAVTFTITPFHANHH